MDRPSPRSIIPTALAVLACAALLALSWPGVRMARADEASESADFDRFMKFVGESPPAAPAQPPASCQAGTGFQGVQERVAAAMAGAKRRALEAQAKQQANGAQPGPRIQNLNTRGYNYGPSPDAAAELGRIQQLIERSGSPPS